MEVLNTIAFGGFADGKQNEKEHAIVVVSPKINGCKFKHSDWNNEDNNNNNK